MILRATLVLLLCLLLPIPAAAQQVDRPKAGILWNRSGLPATFPLQVRTVKGQDYVLFLTDPASGDDKMAGYIRGGEFFRLLVPPGEYQLRFAHGTGWQGPDRLFGDQTGWTEMDKPLDFRVIGIGRRQGYVIRLIFSNGKVKVVDARQQSLCQIAHWDYDPRDWRWRRKILSDVSELYQFDWTLRLRTRLCD